MTREKCRNPFSVSQCENTDIQLYIQLNSERFPICSKCWSKIAISNEEWTYSDKNE